MKAIRVIILTLWALLAIMSIAVPFINTLTLFVKICVAVLGVANIYAIIANIKLVAALNKMQDDTNKED